MRRINFYYYATCKCAAPDAWHAISRYASAEGDLEVTYVQTQTGIGQDRIRALLGAHTIAHMPYIGTENGPLVLLSDRGDAGLATSIAMALA